jgi:uncharacterized protein YicC (UPF0701 family)
MTGFGVGNAPVGGGRIGVEVRAVNGRFLDIRVRLPAELAELSGMVETEARKCLSRGRCDISIRAEGAIFAAPAIDKERARAAYRALVELKDELAPGADVPFSMLSALPDLFSPVRASNCEPVEKAVRAALASALDDLDLMRKKEGRAIADDLSRRVATARQLMEGIAGRAPDLLEIQARKFKERFARISSIVAEGQPDADVASNLPAAGAKAAASNITGVDPLRVEQEMAILLERSDISEELTRLASHVEQMLAYLPDDEPVGRRLDFLLQEMAREINTIGAKSQDLRTVHLVIELKAEIERMREQVQNVE